MIAPQMPEEFPELCEKIGLALMLSQKVQFALAYYFAVYHRVNNGWSVEEVQKNIKHHLSKPMGVVVAAIESSTSLEDTVIQKIRDFRALRNWLAHDFDEESTPFLSQGQRLPEYIERMEEIIEKATGLMMELHEIGEKLIPVKL